MFYKRFNFLRISKKYIHNNIIMPLQKSDPEIYNLIQKEKFRQINGLEMIASENFTSKNVLEAVGSCFTNKYGEGYPGRRYYGGCEIVDELELLCQKRALELFNLDPNEWGVNVQALSGSVANLCAYNGLINIGDKISGLYLPSGGHLTHGFETPKKKISASSIYFDSYPYHLTKDGLINYQELRDIVTKEKINLLICGYSAYPRDIDYEQIKDLDCLKLCDMAHFSGLVAGGVLNNPFNYFDVITTTTHKTLRGPRGALIFYRLKHKSNIDFSVFPRHQGGPFFHCMAGISVALKEANTNEYKNYIKQVVKNMNAFVEHLKQYNYKFITNGTSNHLALWDLKPLGLNGKIMEKTLEKINISINKNTVPGDKSALKPGGIRIGSPALTSRGMKEKDFIQIAEIFHKTIQYELSENKDKKELEILKKEVVELANKFNHPSF